MKFKEFLEELNSYCADNTYYSLDDLITDYFKPRGLTLTYLQTADREEHRWYVIDFNVYSVIIDKQEYFLGIAEIGTIKSEMMTEEDCGFSLGDFVEMEPYPTFLYREKTY